MMTEATLAEYAAVQDAVGLFDFSNRGKIKVIGPDRMTFLHAMVSNDVLELSDWAGRYGTLLTARGRIIADFFYYKFPDLLLVDIRRDLLTRTLEALQKHIIMDEVEIQDVSLKMQHVSLQGPRTLKLVEELFGVSAPSNQQRVRAVQWDQTKIWLIRKDELSEYGMELIFPERITTALRKALIQRGNPLGLCLIGEEVHNILRMEAGIPWYGFDMDENRYPMEAGLKDAISLTKGCYVGQEVVAKATNIGGVTNLLMGLKLRENLIPEKGSPVLNEEGQKMGKITSAVFSPRLECPIAFAYLKRAGVRVGDKYRVKISKDKIVYAEVVDKFV